MTLAAAMPVGVQATIDPAVMFAPAVLFLSTDTTPENTTTIGGEPIRIQVQREAAHRLAIQHELGVVKEFVELRSNTTSLRNRPVLRRMLAYLERHPEVRWAVVPGALPRDVAGIERVQQRLHRLKIGVVRSTHSTDQHSQTSEEEPTQRI
ncbi:recombinase family protein [Nocardia brasiliensis]|uniref:recombinase family protein n=1 Tax=Nocardia brasiliensis TaxID=37326 RepID=UPI0024572D84|nr:recombinase family protein [Nocardia brasiliensis]